MNGIRFKGVPFSTANQEGFASRGSPSPKRMGFASRGSPSPKRLGFASDAGPSCSKRPLSRDSPSPRPRYSRDSLSPKGFASAPSEWDSLREILLLPNDNVLSRGTQILLDGSIHPELRLVRLQLRDPSRGLLPPILIHLHDKIRKLKTPLCQPQLRP